jgi:hypothetical protein
MKESIRMPQSGEMKANVSKQSFAKFKGAEEQPDDFEAIWRPFDPIYIAAKAEGRTRGKVRAIGSERRLWRECGTAAEIPFICQEDSTKLSFNQKFGFENIGRDTFVRDDDEAFMTSATWYLPQGIFADMDDTKEEGVGEEIGVGIEKSRSETVMNQQQPILVKVRPLAILGYKKLVKSQNVCQMIRRSMFQISSFGPRISTFPVYPSMPSLFQSPFRRPPILRCQQCMSDPPKWIGSRA